jgi:hypothetical protein
VKAKRCGAAFLRYLKTSVNVSKKEMWGRNHGKC